MVILLGIVSMVLLTPLFWNFISFDHYFFKMFFCPLPSGTNNYTYIKQLKVVPQLAAYLFFLFQSFFFYLILNSS